ncbi:KAT8 regulatory NSL complex subunit 1-like protein isoform X2 [Tachysurus vachellii]|uniref:KAT8 regulatory NSL complex subunit 1-like protein isoform X2 n=1 Tax=Tachysurus vachellii TaxID=175792 RepID=UPI00296AB900|nr:KAT8 regulatory NSL complex subunit 1-like protein isoform X2 [Tachysurus vachellii]
MDLDPHVKLIDDSYTRFWLNLSSLSNLDSYSLKSPLELPEMPPEPLIHNSEPYKIDLHESLESLLCYMFTDESAADFPLFHEDFGFNEQTAAKEETRTIALDHQYIKQNFSPPQLFQRESESSEIYNRNNNKIALSPLCHCPSYSALQEEMDAWGRQLASQNHALATRADEAKLRLHTLLGENALHNFNTQLEEMRRKLSPTTIKTEPAQIRPAEVKRTDAFWPQEEAHCMCNCFSQQKISKYAQSSSYEDSLMEHTSNSVQLIRGVQNLVRCGHLVLHKAQQALDSDATESSSDEEDEEEESRLKRPSSGCLGCEWRYQCERATLASQWTWLKFRLSELDTQIQQVSRLHQHLTFNKGVVLAEAQHLTDRQVQQSLLTEASGLTLTAKQTCDLTSELDDEHYSPTHLLQNIERQSQILNSLMSPLSDLNAGTCWNDSRKRPINSCVTDAFLRAGSRVSSSRLKRRRLSRRAQLLPHQVCARTRPLLTYYKRRFFAMYQSPVTTQGADYSSYWYSSSLSCDPRSSAPDSSSTNDCTYELESAQMHSKATPIQETLTVKRRRRASDKRQAVIDMCASRSGLFSLSTEDSTEDVLIPNRKILQEKKSQIPVRRRNGESAFNINNIVIPMSMAASTKLEKLEYKDIATPSWRILEISPLIKKEEKKDVNMVESLSDEVFIQRHQIYEHREKVCWSSWEKSRRSTYRTRSPGSTDVSSDCESMSWMCGGLTDTTEEERKPRPPWERRLFPLSESDEEALSCDEGEALEAVVTLWSNNEQTGSSLSESSCKNAYTPPPAGHR